MKIKLLLVLSMFIMGSDLQACSKKVQSKCQALTDNVCYGSKYAFYHAAALVQNVHPLVLAGQGKLVTLQIQNDLGEYTDSLDKLCCAYGIDNADFYETPLQRAVTCGHVDTVKWLLVKGADKNKKSYKLTYTCNHFECSCFSSFSSSKNAHNTDEKKEKPKKEDCFSAVEMAIREVKRLEDKIAILKTGEIALKSFYSEELEKAQAIQKVLE